ncbi:MAG: divalent-cation tolerance protein CutA [Gemmatimonadota bacterium]|nr:MAG: divalent-cation tolerance protein CutA [Gemmatimonadota bacterium]
MVVLSTAPAKPVASRLAKALVERKLAACVNIVGGVHSLYMWKGKMKQDAEVLLVCKTTAERLPDLTAMLQQEHPYDCPEVVALPVIGGSADYLRWVIDAVDG